MYGDDVARALAAIDDKENGRVTEDSKKLETHKILFPSEGSYRKFVAEMDSGNSPTMCAIITLMENPEISEIRISSRNEQGTKEPVSQSDVGDLQKK